MLSLAAFCLFWIFAVVAANSAMHAVVNEDAHRFVAAARLGMFALLMSLTGTVLGILGVVLRTSHKVVAGIGLGLNGVLLLWLLATMFSRH